MVAARGRPGAGLMANTRLIQSPGALVLREGETAEIRCVLNSSNERNIVNKFVVHWYNSPRHSVIKLSLYSYGSTYRSAGFSERFQLSRDVASNSYSLTIREVVISDSADYICGIWGEIFGNGTQLNVTIANPPILIQLPRLERVTEGHTARLRCSMENAEVGSTDVHWYRELPGQDMEWVLTHEAGGSVRRRPGFTERFQPFRDASNSSFTLTVTNVTLNDSAAYYCTVWGDIRGNGTQLNVTKPYEKLSLKILGSIVACVLVFVLLFSILAIAVCYLKKWVCFQFIFKPEGSSTEDLNTVHSTVTVETKTNTKPATNVTMSAESEVFYADIQFARRNTKAPTIEVSEETTEYAAIKRA
ncbi:uncharacterized protein LOC144596756 isoform X4 [Rhinoraja longicauda]